MVPNVGLGWIDPLVQFSTNRVGLSRDLQSFLDIWGQYAIFIEMRMAAPMNPAPVAVRQGGNHVS
jgi:hypothetical protein